MHQHQQRSRNQMLEERLSELNATLKEVIKALANVGVTVNNMPPMSSPNMPAAAPPTPTPAAETKRGPGRPPAAKAEPAPTKAGAKPPKQPEPAPVRETPIETAVSEAPERKVTIDQVRSLLVRIMETHNKAEGDATGKTGPGGERAKADLERVSGYGRLPLVPAEDYPAVFDALAEIAEALENAGGSDEGDFE